MNSWEASEGKFRSWDGTELFFRSWSPKIESNKALIIIHRGHEHSGRIGQLVQDIGLPEFWAFSWDNRGHGLSPGERGHAESYGHLVKDLNSFVQFIAKEYEIPVENMVIVANSVGAATASAWVHDFAPRIRGMVLAAPAFRIKLYIPFAIPLLRILLKFKNKAVISSYVKSRMLTHDPVQMRQYDSDKLITKDIAVNVLLGLHDVSTRIINDAGAITTPTLILSAGADWVVKNSAQRQFYSNLSSSFKQMETFPGFYHALLYEKDRHKPMEKIRGFIWEIFEMNVDASFLFKADKGGFTRTEYDILRQKPSLPKALWFGLQKLMMKTVGKLSEGIRLGWKTGFDSGKSLDYIYENNPRGITELGRAIDRQYLQAVGWKGIRERREHLEKSIKQAIDSMVGSGEPVRLLDVATGCGRYVLNVLDEYRDADVFATLRDFTKANLEQGKRLAAGMGLKNVKFEFGDAFDPESAKTVDPKPNIAIVSGLYELFPDNQMVLNSLKAIAEITSPGGFLIYTGQPWHPQVEMIARTLTNREGKPWIMRRRSQAEMDELARQAGFEKTQMEIDSWGIFTVSTARRVQN